MKATWWGLPSEVHPGGRNVWLEKSYGTQHVVVVSSRYSPHGLHCLVTIAAVAADRPRWS